MRYDGVADVWYFHTSQELSLAFDLEIPLERDAGAKGWGPVTFPKPGWVKTGNRDSEWEQKVLSRYRVAREAFQAMPLEAFRAFANSPVLDNARSLRSLAAADYGDKKLKIPEGSKLLLKSPPMTYIKRPEDPFEAFCQQEERQAKQREEHAAAMRLAVSHLDKPKQPRPALHWSQRVWNSDDPLHLVRSQQQWHAPGNR